MGDIMAVKKRTKEILSGFTYKIRTPCGNMYLTINYDTEDNNKIIETLIRLGKVGNCPSCFLEALSRTIGLILKNFENNDEAVYEIYQQFKGLRCFQSTPKRLLKDEKEFFSCPVIISETLLEFNKKLKTEVKK